MSPLPPAIIDLLRHAETDPHARSALRAYAISVRPFDRRLANELTEVLHQLPPLEPR